MMDLEQDIQSLTSFKRNSPAFLKRMKESGRPLVLTVNGRASMVAMDVACYQRLIDSIERVEAIEGIKAGLASVVAGRAKPADRVFAELRRKHDLPD